MIRPTPAWRALAVLGAAALVLTACGGDDDTPGTGPTGTLPAGDGTLKIGTLLPQTGSLSALGPPEFAGVDLAAQEINAAGGVLGKQVTVSDSDSGDTTTDIASQSVDRLLGEKVDVIVGAASSSVSLSVIDKITTAGVVQISPANTSDELTTYADKGLYFRTAPPDVLQGRVLGNLVAGDGHSNVAIMALQDAYGTGLADNAEKTITDGGGTVVLKEIYDPQTTDFSSIVGKVKSANADSLIIISFGEFPQIAQELTEQGLTPDKLPWYMVDGNLDDYTEELPAGTLKTVKGTLPGAAAPEDFQQKLLAIDAGLDVFAYAPEAYDATILAALAAEAAGSDNGQAIAAKLIEVSTGGEKCTTFADCKAKIAEGKDIDYDGVSGPVEFNAAGDPSEAVIGIYQYGDENTFTNLDYISGNIAG